jgi:hypothetical protein
MYVDRLDRRITAAFYDEKAKEWDEQQKQIEERRAQLRTTELRSAEEALQIIRSVSDACGSFQQNQPQQQQRSFRARCSMRLGSPGSSSGF